MHTETASTKTLLPEHEHTHTHVHTKTYYEILLSAHEEFLSDYISFPATEVSSANGRQES